MTPQDFIAKWRNNELKERSASQSHFNDLCRLLELDDPTTADGKGEWFTFEKGASKTSGGEGWADVWRKDSFAWEYKGKRANLDKAFDQLLQYSIALENPPLLIVSDMDVIRIHTNWTNTVQKVHTIALADLTDAANRDLLRNAFENPERLKPAKTRQLLTEEAAEKFAGLAQRLRTRGSDPERVAHFVNRLVFCMFAEDVQLLPNKMFERMIKTARKKPESFEGHARKLFAAMKSGGEVGFESVEWFNGGLFDSDDALPLDWQDLDDLIRASALDWSDIDPSILGTLFERGLDPDKRSQLGAHYTDREKIMMIVKPVIVEPLLAEWATVKAEIARLIDTAPQATKDKLLVDRDLAARTRALDKAEALHRAYLNRLKAFRVLDPACGSGNFLYLSLLELKNIEHRTNLEAEALGLPRAFPTIGPESVLGIELNPYAAELARVSVWIGEIQWMRRNGFEAGKNPILRTLDTIECRDAVLGTDGARAEWPKADAVVGNPPFLGDKKMRSSFGREYTLRLRAAFKGAIAGRSDLVCYWFAQSLAQLEKGLASRVGLVSTNSIRQKSNNGILEKIATSFPIFLAWADEPWVVDGAAVRVSLVCFGMPVKGLKPTLNGGEVNQIHPDLTEGSGQAENYQGNVSKLVENSGVAFQGIKRGGSFEIPRDLAVSWVALPSNPNSKKNSEVLRPWASGFDVVRRPQDFWIVDFGWDTPFQEASLFEVPFQHLEKLVKPERVGKRETRANEMWWIFYWPRPEMRTKLQTVGRYFARPSVSKHQIFRWFDSSVLPDGSLIVITKDDDTTFGILHSHFHEVWGLSRGSTLEDRPAYTPSTTFETFPFPQGLTPNIPAADFAADPHAIKIAAAAKRLNELRENWLNPADLVDRVPEVVAGYPDRILPKDDAAAKELKKRTLTNLYNARPAWLDHAHKALDEAVAEAYGWGDDWRGGKLTDEEILARLFKLNQERAKAEAEAAAKVKVKGKKNGK